MLRKLCEVAALSLVESLASLGLSINGITAGQGLQPVPLAGAQSGEGALLTMLHGRRLEQALPSTSALR